MVHSSSIWHLSFSQQLNICHIYSTSSCAYISFIQLQQKTTTTNETNEMYNTAGRRTFDASIINTIFSSYILCGYTLFSLIIFEWKEFSYIFVSVIMMVMMMIPISINFIYFFWYYNVNVLLNLSRVVFPRKKIKVSISTSFFPVITELLFIDTIDLSWWSMIIDQYTMR